MNHSAKQNSNRSNHKDLYKSPLRLNQNRVEIHQEGEADQSPSWRDVYKKRCLEEFKQSRQKLINKFRNFNLDGGGEDTQNVKTPGKIQHFLQQELKKICAEYMREYMLEAKTNKHLVTIDEASDIFKQIELELMPHLDKDNAFGEEWIRTQEIEEEYVSNLITNESNSTFCPICQKSILIEQNSAIICNNKSGCDFKIDTSQTCIGLAQLSSSLQKATAMHCCNEIPQFQYKRADSIDQNELIVLRQLSSLPNASAFLLMCCEKCQFTQIII